MAQFFQHRPAAPVLLVRLHQDTEQQNHAPVPAALQGRIKLGAGPIVERGWRDEKNKVHPHVFEMGSKWQAIDKLVAQEVLGSNIKEAQDLDLWPVIATTATSVANAMLHTPHQPSDITAIELIVPSIRWGKPEAAKPLPAKIVQVIGYFLP